MRLVYSLYNLDIQIEENMVNVLIVENPEIFSALIQDMISEENWVLSEPDKILTFDKTASFIINPFLLDCNERKVIQKLYQEIDNSANDYFVQEMAELQGQIVSIISQVIETVPYDITFDFEQSFQGLLKLYNVHIDNECDSLLEKIGNYIKTLHRICHISVFIFVNLKTYLSENELKELYISCFYEKIHLILFENQQKECLEYEKMYILDKEYCIIKSD